jgi:hypothetical protein
MLTRYLASHTRYPPSKVAGNPFGISRPRRVAFIPIDLTIRHIGTGVLLGEIVTDCAEVKRGLNKILVSCDTAGFLPIAFYSDGFTCCELG